MRWAGALSALIGVFAAGAAIGSANRGWRRIWSTLASRVTHITGPIQLGISVFLVAVAVAIIVMTTLVWLAGKEVIDGARSQQERVQAYKLVAVTLLNTLRVSNRNAIFNQEPDIFGQERDDTPPTQP